MKALFIARKMLREVWREPQLFWVFMLFPALMVWVYYAAFGQPATAMASYLKIHILDEDRSELSSELAGRISGLKYGDSPVFNVTIVSSREESMPYLSDRKIALLVVIPSGFSRETGAARVTLVGDPLTDQYVYARSFLWQAAREFSAQSAHQAPAEIFRYEFVPGTGSMSDFQYGVPGIIVFGILFGIIATAMILAREYSTGTLQRLRLAQVISGDILGGTLLAMAVLAIVQLLLACVVAWWFDFRSPGSLWLALAVGLIFNMGTTGMGMAIAAFSRSEGDATTLATVVMTPLVFLSGAIFPMPSAVLFTIAGQPVSVYDLMFSTHASEAMRRVLVYGDGPRAIWYSLAGLVGLSVLTWIAGAWLYQKRRINLVS